MRLAFFAVPTRAPGDARQELNRLLGIHRIAALDAHASHGRGLKGTNRDSEQAWSLWCVGRAVDAVANARRRLVFLRERS